MPEQDAATGNSSKVSWRDLYNEIQRLQESNETRGERIYTRIDQLRLDTLERMERMRAESAARAQAERAVLEEIRDSTGALHAVITTLPCDVHSKRGELIIAELSEIKEQLVHWKWMWSWASKKTIAGLVGAALGLLGWDKLGDTLRNWGK